MAQLKDTLIQGSARVTDTLYSNKLNITDTLYAPHLITQTISTDNQYSTITLQARSVRAERPAGSSNGQTMTFGLPGIYFASNTQGTNRYIQAQYGNMMSTILSLDSNNDISGLKKIVASPEITGTLKLTKTTDASGTANNSPALIVGGPATAAHLEFDANDIMAKASGTTVGPLYLNNDGGAVYIDGGYGTTSVSTAVDDSGLRVYARRAANKSVIDAYNGFAAASGTYSWGLNHLAPNIVVGANTCLLTGVANSTNNQGVLEFHYAGSNNAGNYVGLGLYGNNGLLKIFKDKTVEINSTLAASSDSLTVKVGTAGTTFTVAKFEGSAFLPGLDTAARYIGSNSNLWANTYTEILTAGSRVTTTQPANGTENSIDRMIITPYYHTGGPWKIRSVDNSTTAFLTLNYGSSEKLRINSNGEFHSLASLNVNTFRYGSYSHICNAGGGTAGYFKFATIVVNSTYSNRGMQISYTSRGRVGGTIYLIFSNQNGVDPTLTVYNATSDAEFSYVRTAASTWDLYVNKSESHDNAYFSIINPGEMIRGITWTWKNETVTSLPAGAQVTYQYYAPIQVAYAAVAGDAEWAGGASSALKTQALSNYYPGGRLASADIEHVVDGGVVHFKATSTMTTSKPMGDGHILHFFWDNSAAWNSQLYVPDSASGSMQWRGSSAAGTWGTWKTLLDNSNYTNYTVTKTGTGASGTWGISITGTASKLGTATVGSANRGIYLNAGTPTALTWYHNYVTVTSGNTNNYPWHRVATTNLGTGSWIDRDAILFIQSRYNGGSFGVIKISARANNATTSPPQATSVSATWMVRYGFAVADVKIARKGASGQSAQCDVYVKCNTHMRAYAYLLEGANYAWTLLSSNEVDNTTVDDKKTSIEVYPDVTTSIGAIAYDNVTIALDGGTVNRANYADTAQAAQAATNSTNLRNFKVTTTTNLGIDGNGPGTNAIGYVSGLTKADWNYQQTDGALISQWYNNSWITEIFQDYRTGQLSVRGKNGTSWQPWRRILDETNGATILGLSNYRLNTQPHSGAWFTGTPVVGSDGVTEIGKYIDFHSTNAGTSDYDARITATTSGLTLSGTTTGTFSGNLTGNVTGTVSGNAGSATKLANARTLWGQNFNGTANVTGNMTNVGPAMTLPSGQATFGFYKSDTSAANAHFGRLGLNSTYANIDITNYVLDANGASRFGGKVTINHATPTYAFSISNSEKASIEYNSTNHVLNFIVT